MKSFVGAARARAVAGAVSILLLSACGGGGSDDLRCMRDHPRASADEIKACNNELDKKVDSFIQPFMSKHGVTAATVTVMKNNVVLYEKGYGFKDVGQTTALPSNALMLISSTTKPVTAAAIRKLASTGALSLNDHVFCDGSNAPCWLSTELPASEIDSRARDITIQHLLDHRGGWDRNVSGDPYGMDALIQAQQGLSTPPVAANVIRFVLAQPLDFAPGTQVAYSNFGYMLLGQIIEKSSRKAFISYVNETILSPLGIPREDFQMKPSLLKDRNAREPNYITSIMAPSVFFPGTRVTAHDGVLSQETWAAAGGVIATSKALATFAGHYRLPDGELLHGTTNDGGHDGENPGASSLVRQLTNGVSYAVIMNRSDPTSEPFIQCMIDQCASPPKLPSTTEVPWQTQFLQGIDNAVRAAGF